MWAVRKARHRSGPTLSEWSQAGSPTCLLLGCMCCSMDAVVLGCLFRLGEGVGRGVCMGGWSGCSHAAEFELPLLPAVVLYPQGCAALVLAPCAWGCWWSQLRVAGEGLRLVLGPQDTVFQRQKRIPCSVRGARMGGWRVPGQPGSAFAAPHRVHSTSRACCGCLAQAAGVWQQVACMPGCQPDHSCQRRQC